MDISFTHKTETIYRELSHPVKRIQESAESVVPDTNEDIGRIASVQTTVLLKSKDVTGRGVTVTGELNTVVLYITENENGVSAVKLRKDFDMEFDLGEMQADTLAQIRLSVSSTEAHVLNPRKVAVTVELVGELSCYRQEEMPVETSVPESAMAMLHYKTENTEMSAANAVCEKAFALNEQYRFPEGKPEPTELVSESVDFSVDDVQQVGSRVVVKGTVFVDVCYLSPEVSYPVKAEFSSPFSQIVDTGAEICSDSTVFVELTSAYFDLVDTLSGEKALDTELHALLQMVSRNRRELSYLSDAYSNRFPSVCKYQSSAVGSVSEMQRIRLNGEGELNIAEDCEDVLSVFTSVSQLALAGSELNASVSLDVIYRCKGGELSAVRRTVNLEQTELPPSSRLCAGRISNVDIRPDSGTLRYRVSLEAVYQSFSAQEISDVTAVTIAEDAGWEQADFPTVTLVRTTSTNLWELAKRYHSSVEAIQAANEIPARSGLLLIPRET